MLDRTSEKVGQNWHIGKQSSSVSTRFVCSPAMHHVKAALESTTCHGPPRMVTGKPIYVRLAWLAVFCVCLSFFLKGFIEFVGKLKSNPVTNSQDVNAVDFQFPDVYTCFENPISGSYSANINAATAAEINNQLNKTRSTIWEYASTKPPIERAYAARFLSFTQPLSLKYQLLVDTLAQKLEQNVIVGGLVYKDTSGMLRYENMNLSSFYHPVYLRCAKWVLDSKQAESLKKSGTNAGLLLKVLLDLNSSFIPTRGAQISEAVYALDFPMPVTEWPLSLQDILATDRASGLRVYLSPPGEYPTDFGTSFLLSPGKFHMVEIGMTQQVYKAGQFDCINDIPAVQFLNPYERTPYNYSYSYSYCFYYEYQKLYQKFFNMSADSTPMPWELRDKNCMFNLSSWPNLISILKDPTTFTRAEDIQQRTASVCDSKRPCTTSQYSVSISSSDWPTESSLVPFISTSVRDSWMKANLMNVSVPALDFLMTGNTSSVASYLRSNLLKAFFKPRSMTSDTVTFSRDYGASNFVSDVGGIMGIYLGMSILTLCEILELIYDLVSHAHTKRRARQPAVSVLTPMTSEQSKTSD